VQAGFLKSIVSDLAEFSLIIPRYSKLTISPIANAVLL